MSFERRREDDALFLLQLLTQQSGGGGGAGGRPPPGAQPAPYRVTLLQSGGSFFAYAPILKALQGMAEVPLGEYLTAPAAPPVAGELTHADRGAVPG